MSKFVRVGFVEGKHVSVFGGFGRESQRKNEATKRQSGIYSNGRFLLPNKFKLIVARFLWSFDTSSDLVRAKQS